MLTVDAAVAAVELVSAERSLGLNRDEEGPH
jgi:hypothetical protein